MANETDDPDVAADRLEAALERIALLAAQPRPAPETAAGGAPMPGDVPGEAPEDAPGDTASDETPTTAEIAERLDDLIERLRTVLGK